MEWDGAAGLEVAVEVAAEGWMGRLVPTRLIYTTKRPSTLSSSALWQPHSSALTLSNGKSKQGRYQTALHDTYNVKLSTQQHNDDPTKYLRIALLLSLPPLPHITRIQDAALVSV